MGAFEVKMNRHGWENKVSIIGEGNKVFLIGFLLSEMQQKGRPKDGFGWEIKGITEREIKLDVGVIWCL